MPLQRGICYITLLEQNLVLPSENVAQLSIKYDNAFEGEENSYNSTKQLIFMALIFHSDPCDS